MARIPLSVRVHKEYVTELDKLAKAWGKKRRWTLEQILYNAFSGRFFGSDVTPDKTFYEEKDAEERDE